MSRLPATSQLVEMLRNYPFLVRRLADFGPMVTTTALSLIGRSVGVAIPVAIAAFFGASEATDAFLFVYGIVLFVVGIVSAAVETMVVPFAIKIQGDGDDHALDEFVGAVVLVSGGVMTIVGAAVLLVSRAGLATATDLADISLAYQLLVEVSPLFPLVAISSVFNGVLNARRVFWFPALSPGIRGLTVLWGMWSFHETLGVHALPVSYVGGEVVRGILAAMLVSMKCHVRPRFRLSFTDAQLEFARSSVLLASGAGVGGLMPLVDRAFASRLGIGNVSLLAYARSVFFIPVTLVQSGFLVVSLTRIAELYSQSHRTIGSIMQSRTIVVAALAAGLAVVGWALSTDVIELLYGQSLGAAELSVVDTTLKWSMLALMPYLIGSQLAQGLVVTRALRPLLLWTCLGLVVLAIGNGVLVWTAGLPGIALANLLAHSVMGVGLGATVIRRERTAQAPGGEPLSSSVR